MKIGFTRRNAAREAASGYAVLMALFLVASLILIVSVATPSLLLQGRREREDETVWRGKQYVRAIRLYFQKNGRYPASLDDLTKPGLSNVHFLRKVYTDPMNRADGTWRAIYMSPTGQLTGSVRYHSLQEMALAQGLAVPAPAIAPQGIGQPASTQPAAGQPGAAVAPQGAGGLSSTTSPATPVPLQAVTGPVMGGLVIGVGSKVKESSVRVYEGGDTYFQWEFIFNPLANGAQLPSATPAAGAPAAGQPATGQPAAGQPGNGQPAFGQPTTGQPTPSRPANGMPPANSPGGLSTQ
jgi:hypothetical protein